MTNIKDIVLGGLLTVSLSTAGLAYYTYQQMKKTQGAEYVAMTNKAEEVYGRDRFEINKKLREIEKDPATMQQIRTYEGFGSTSVLSLLVAGVLMSAWPQPTRKN